MSAPVCDKCGKRRKTCCSESRVNDDGKRVYRYAVCVNCCVPHGPDDAINAFAGLREGKASK